MNEKYMHLALLEAKKAYKKGEVPIGAVIVRNNKIISKAHNLIEKKQNSIMHAEIIAISKASKKLKNWRLIDCDMYVTLEPCLMCASAIELSRINKVYFLTSKDKNIKIDNNKYIHIKSNLNDESLSLIKNFFKSKR